MTNEEAKSIISNIDKAYRTFSKEEIQALEKAITVLEQEPCEDCISRDAVQNYVGSYIQEINTGYGDLNDHTNRILRMIVDGIGNMLSIQPKPKTGHWIEHPHETGENWEYSKYECSECHAWKNDDSDYCPDCGVKMQENKK